MARKRKKHWSKMIEETGVRMRIFERPNSENVWYSIVRDGRKVRKSLKTGDRSLAEERARAIALVLAEQQLTGKDPRRLTLHQVFEAYFRLKGPGLTESWRKLAEARRGLFETCWGAEKLLVDVSQADVERFCRLRRSGSLTPLGRGEGRGDRKPIRVRDGTLDGDFRWLSSVFNWAVHHKVDGKPVLNRNPLHDLPKKKEWGQSRWPKEKNPLRPVASHDRYLKTLKMTSDVDSHGRLGCMLTLARYTGHRESAICHLKASDLLLDPTAIRRALAELGTDESRADHMPFGAIRWRSESDKEGIHEILPMNEKARESVDYYLSQNPRLGEAWLFPSPKDDSLPIRRDLAGRWLLKAEKLAELPKLKGGVWHPYRRLWAVERKHLPDVDVAAAGGWRDTRALRLSYQRADPETTLAVVQASG